MPGKQDPGSALGWARGVRAAGLRATAAGGGQEPATDQAALIIEAALFEYSLLREEVLHIRGRQSQLVVFVGAGVGALISSTLLTTYGSDRGALAAILFVAALVVGAATVNYVGNANMIILIGGYLADRSDEIREVLSETPEPRIQVPPGLFTWERRSIRESTNFASPEGRTVWGPASFELISVAVLGLALWISGVSVMFTYPEAQRGIDYVLFGLCTLALFTIIAWCLYGLRYNQQRTSGRQ